MLPLKALKVSKRNSLLVLKGHSSSSLIYKFRSFVPNHSPCHNHNKFLLQYYHNIKHLSKHKVHVNVIWLFVNNMNIFQIEGKNLCKPGEAINKWTICIHSNPYTQEISVQEVHVVCSLIVFFDL